MKINNKRKENLLVIMKNKIKEYHLDKKLDNKIKEKLLVMDKNNNLLNKKDKILNPLR